MHRKIEKIYKWTPIIMSVLGIAIIILLVLVFGNIKGSVMIFEKSQARLTFLGHLLQVLTVLPLLAFVIMLIDLVKDSSRRGVYYKWLGLLGTAFFGVGMVYMNATLRLSVSAQMSEIMDIDSSIASLIVGTCLLGASFYHVQKGNKTTTTWITIEREEHD